MVIGVHAWLRGSAISAPLLLMGAVGLVTSPPLNLYLLGETIASGTVLVAVGTYEALVIVLTAMWGIVFFSDLDHYRPTQALLLVGGLLLTLLGVVALNCKWGHADGPLSPKRDAKPTMGAAFGSSEELQSLETTPIRSNERSSGWHSRAGSVDDASALAKAARQGVASA